MLVELANRLHRDVVAGVVLLLLALSGLILWWPRKILIPRGPALSARTDFELYSVVGLYSSLILVIFSVTSVIMIYSHPANRTLRDSNCMPDLVVCVKQNADYQASGGHA